MTIKKIKISNFKSFKNLEVELSKFNVLIGANASGKSNFIHIFEFLRDLTNFGLDSAISMQGGVEYFGNINIGSSKHFSIEITDAARESYTSAVEELGVEGYETTYRFSLEFIGGRNFGIVQDELLQKCNFYEYTKRRGKTVKERTRKGEIVLSRKGSIPSFSFNPPKGMKIEPDTIFQVWVTQRACEAAKTINPRTLIMENAFLTFIGNTLKSSLKSIPIYDFDPKLPKKAQAITGRAKLEEDGSNLAIVLKNIMRSRNNKRKLFNLLQNILPFVSDLRVETFADKSLMFKLQESYLGRRFLPASLVSDGTINVIALIVSLYFGEEPLRIIEEPGRNIHPYLISRMVSMMKEASENSQIIVTTHNPEIVKNADLKDVLLISRDKNGYSSISKPSEKKEIQVFLEKQMGIEELYVRNLLEM